MTKINKIVVSDCIAFLEGLEAESVDSCVTDPPYGLDFMGKEWDSFDNKKQMQEFHFKWATALFRVLKSGAHVLVFSGTRTYHRLACAFEDTGFEVRDMLAWIYGTGFPKGQNIAKAIDKKHGLEQPIIGRQETSRPIAKGDYERIGKIPFATDEKDGSMSDPSQMGVITQPITQEAQQWQGWNTALKPAQEPILLARKPLKEKTIVDNVLSHGTGAINMDGCRIATNPNIDDMRRVVERKKRETVTWEEGSGFKNESNEFTGVLPSGRYPANVILSHHPSCELVQDGITETHERSLKPAKSPLLGKYGVYGSYEPEYKSGIEHKEIIPEIWNCHQDCPIRMVDEQSGITASVGGFPINLIDERLGWKGSICKNTGGLGDRGGASRFFYCAKAYKKERNAGLGYYLKGEIIINEQIVDTIDLEDILFNKSKDEIMNLGCIRFTKEEVQNPHVTVKPIELMRYLVRLVTPKGGTVVEPFLGSGTTAIAAMMEGFNFLACDISEEYVEVSRKRLAYWKDPPIEKPVRKTPEAQEGQETLDEYFEE